MAVLVDTDTRLVVQGLTGSEGRFHGLRNREHGTQVVAGVTPGKGGQDVEGIPIFDTIAAAVDDAGANTAMVFVPAPFAADAIYEAVDAGVATIVCITEGVPAHGMLRLHAFVHARGVRLIGPNCPGALRPDERTWGSSRRRSSAKVRSGSSRSGTLTYQIGHELTQLGLGNSTIVGIGGDPVVGSSFVDVLALFEADPETEQVVMVGEIGGDEEGEGGGVHRGRDVEARRGVHRRVHGAAGEDDGARGGDHFGLVWNCRGQERRARGARHPRGDDSDRGCPARRRVEVARSPGHGRRAAGARARLCSAWPVSVESSHRSLHR